MSTNTAALCCVRTGTRSWKPSPSSSPGPRVPQEVDREAVSCSEISRSSIPGPQEPWLPRPEIPLRPTLADQHTGHQTDPADCGDRRTGGSSSHVRARIVCSDAVSKRVGAGGPVAAGAHHHHHVTRVAHGFGQEGGTPNILAHGRPSACCSAVRSRIRAGRVRNRLERLDVERVWCMQSMPGGEPAQRRPSF